MELDELKSLWQSLDRRLEQQNALAWHQLKTAKAGEARSGLRPMWWGQICQILSGVLLISASVPVWTRHLDVPHLLIAGLSMHAYSVLMIVFGGRTLWLIRRVDYAAPVFTIQRQLAELRRYYALGGMVIGLPWWFLWVPFLMVVLAGLFGADLYARAPSVVAIGMVSGIVGLLVTLWFHRWARQPGRARLSKWMDDVFAGASLRRAQGILDEIKQFEVE